MDSILIVNGNGRIILEKNFTFTKDRLPAQLKTFLGDLILKSSAVEPILQFKTDLILITVKRLKLHFIATISSEVQPLFVIEFLNRIADTFIDYFEENVTEAKIKENIILVHQILQEMYDHSFPLTTESSVLKELLLPPTLVNKVVTNLLGSSSVSSTLPRNSLSNVPWRRNGIQYGKNEIFFDCLEEVDLFVDSKGKCVVSEVHGELWCNSKLSGTPDLLFSFTNAHMIIDFSLHPCVRVKRFMQDRVLSFVPPDGLSMLMSYKIPLINSLNSINLPLKIRKQTNFTQTMGKIDLSVVKTSPRVTIDSVSLKFMLPENVESINVLTCSAGKYLFDIHTKTLSWDIGALKAVAATEGTSSSATSSDPLPMFSANVQLKGKLTRPVSPVLNVDFNIGSFAASGLHYDKLQLLNENYTFYKGIRFITRSGNYQIRD
jgi:AP-3 complex subunit mu